MKTHASRPSVSWDMLPDLQSTSSSESETECVLVSLNSRERRKLLRQTPEFQRALRAKQERMREIEEESCRKVLAESVQLSTNSNASQKKPAPQHKKLTVGEINERGKAFYLTTASAQDFESRLDRTVHPAWFSRADSLDNILETVQAAYDSAMEFKRGKFTVCDLEQLEQELTDWYYDSTLPLEAVRIDQSLFSAFVFVLGPKATMHTHIVRHYWLTAFGNSRGEVEKHIRATVPVASCVVSQSHKWDYDLLVDTLLDIAFDDAHACPYVTRAVADVLREAFYARDTRVCPKVAVTTKKGGKKSSSCNEEDTQDAPVFKNAGQGKSKRKTPRKAVAR